MDFIGKSTGWKKAAKVNYVVLISISTIFLVFLVLSTLRAGGIGKILFLYEDKCITGNASRVNVLLHLLINIISTAVVSSTLFPPKCVEESDILREENADFISYSKLYLSHMLIQGKICF